MKAVSAQAESGSVYAKQNLGNFLLHHLVPLVGQRYLPQNTNSYQGRSQNVVKEKSRKLVKAHFGVLSNFGANTVTRFGVILPPWHFFI